MPRLKIGNIYLNVQQLNNNCDDTIIMIHGLGYGSLAMWYFNIAPALAKKYRVVMYDQKSHGKSDQAPTGYDLATLTDELAELLNVLNIKSASFVGFSFGAFAALRFACRFPEKVNKLVLIEAPYTNDGMDTSFLLNGSYTEQGMESYRHRLSEKMHRIVASSNRQKNKHNDMFRYLFNETTLIDDIYDEKDFEEKELSAIDKKTLLLYGSDSPHKPTGFRLNKAIRSSELQYAEGGHDLPVTNPWVVIQHLTQFFEVEVETIIKSVV